MTKAGTEPSGKKRWKQRTEIIEAADRASREGDLCAYEGKYEEAIRCYDHALEILPSQSDVLVFKAITLSGGLHRHDEALECWSKAQALDPGIRDAFSERVIEEEHKLPLPVQNFPRCRQRIRTLMEEETDIQKEMLP